MKDVLRRSDLTDYTGEIRMEVGVRVTDKKEHAVIPAAPVARNRAFTLGWTVPCRKTAATTIGGDCVLATKADALVPGLVKEGVRAIWQIDQMRVFDGGADFDGDTPADNRLYCRPGTCSSPERRACA